MPFTDIFMTPALMFSGERKPRGAPGAANPVACGSVAARGPIRARTGWAETEDQIHLCPLPSGPFRVSPSTGSPSLLSWVSTLFLPEGLC